MRTTMILILAAMGLCAGCDNLSTPQKTAIGGAALGTGIAAVAGAPFGAVVGAGLIGGAVGYLGGTAIDHD
jgi:hypothetical protein